MLEIKDLIYIILITILFILYCRKNNQENMTNTEETAKTDEIKDIIKEKINEVYQADIQAIRNLSDIAEKLQGGGDSGDALVLPSNVVIRGNLTVDNDSNVKGTGKFGEKGVFGVNSGRTLVIQPSRFKDEQTHLAFYDGHKRTGYVLPHRNGKLSIKGNVIVDGPTIVKGNLFTYGNSGNVLKENGEIKVNSVKTNQLNVNNIQTNKLNCSGTINCKYLENKNGAEFCKASGRPVRLQNNDNYGETSWVSFYKGQKRCGYISGNANERKVKLTHEAKV